MPAHPSPKSLLLIPVLFAAFSYSPEAKAVVDCASVQGYEKALDMAKTARGCQKDCAEAEKETAKRGGCTIDKSPAVSERIEAGAAKASAAFNGDTQKGAMKTSEATLKDGVNYTKDTLRASENLGKYAGDTKKESLEGARRKATLKHQRIKAELLNGKGSLYSNGKDQADLPRRAPPLKNGFSSTYSSLSSRGEDKYIPPRKDSIVTSDGGSGGGMRGGRAGDAGVSADSNSSGVSSNAGNGYSGGSAGGTTGGSGLPVPGLPATPEELAKAAADLRLVEKAQQRIRQNKPFPREEALRANDPQVRKDLLVLSAAQEAQSELKKEEVRLEQQLVELIEIKTLSKERAENFGDLAEALAGRRETKANGQPEKPGELAVNDPAADSKVVEGATQAPPAETEDFVKGVADAETEEKAADAADPKAGSLPAPDGAELRQARRQGLRDKLDAYLKQRQGADAKILDTAFDGKLAREASDKTNDEETAHGLGDVIGTAFSTVRDATFSMRMSETEAEVNALLSASQRELASLAAGGVLSSDSTNLFERVSIAHRRCEEHRCVRGNDQP
jgi:hypothetical protein